MNRAKQAFFAFMITGMVVSTSLTAANLNLGFVDFKQCVEKSQRGKDELKNFETMKKQMEEVLTSKEKELKEIGSKLNDPDYMDSLSDSAEAELKHKGRNLSQEMSRAQNEYFQMIQQANMQVVQMIREDVKKAAEKVAKNRKLDAIFNDDSVFYSSSSFDVSQEIVDQMDEDYKK